MAKKPLQKQTPSSPFEEEKTLPEVKPPQSKTGWKWRRQHVLPLILLLGFLALGIQAEIHHQRHLFVLSEQQAAASQDAQSQREALIISQYEHRLTDLLIQNNLMHATKLDEVRLFARAFTVPTLKQLGAQGKGVVILYLLQARLIHEDTHPIELHDVDLRGIDVHGLDLREIYFLGADLSRANLQDCNLSFATLSFANLTDANLAGVNLQSTDLSNTNFTNADLSNAQLKSAINTNTDQLSKAKSLKGATMPDGTLHP